MEVLAFMPKHHYQPFILVHQLKREPDPPERTTTSREEQAAVFRAVGVCTGVARVAGDNAPGLRMGFPAR